MCIWIWIRNMEILSKIWNLHDFRPTCTTIYLLDIPETVSVFNFTAASCTGSSFAGATAWNKIWKFTHCPKFEGSKYNSAYDTYSKTYLSQTLITCFTSWYEVNYNPIQLKYYSIKCKIVSKFIHPFCDILLYLKYKTGHLTC